jgi:N-acetylmuramoyl-L-alanine amidase
MRVSEASVHSARLAHDVHDELISGILPHYPGVQDLGVKKGPFYVLFLSNMPSILVETGFVTHRGESKRLMKESYLDLMAIQIADGLDDYRKGILSVASRGVQAR